MQKIGNREINSIAVCDDNEVSRETLSDILGGCNLVAIPLSGPLLSIDQTVTILRNQSQAVLCDYQINIRRYASFTGAQLADSLYRVGFPAVLITMYGKAEVDQIRKYRRRIPSLLRSDAEIDEILNGFEQCISELAGTWSPDRRPWKTLLRIENVDTDRKLIDVIIPAWNSREIIRLPYDAVPPVLLDYVIPGERFYASVNLGAETYEDIYLDDFEYRGKIGTSNGA